MKTPQQMIADIQTEIEFTRGMTGINTFSDRVMAAMASVPRHQFVPPDLHLQAYENRPLPIGSGQTISQPYIVALMTELLATQPEHIILEVGAGSCYQAAILAQLVKRVYTMEIVESLAKIAYQRMQDYGYNNVEVIYGDGASGLTDHAPFDGIIVTAAAPFIPQPLIDQLRTGGHLVIPVGQPYSHQQLMVVEKKPSGKITTRDILAVAFVPLTGTTLIK